jgi:hypothetical protein
MSDPSDYFVGYAQCACCGYDCVSNDTRLPTLCSECAEAGCDLEGSDPQCDKALEEEGDVLE